MCICRAVKSHRTFSKPLVSISVPKGLDPADPSTGYPPKGIDIRSDHWLWEFKEVNAKQSGIAMEKDFRQQRRCESKYLKKWRPSRGQDSYHREESLCDLIRKPTAKRWAATKQRQAQECPSGKNWSRCPGVHEIGPLFR